jgi:hypothetical protein
LKRALKSKELELLNGTDIASIASPSSPSIMTALGLGSAAVPQKRSLTILDLPPETLKDIFQFVRCRSMYDLL